MWTILLLHLSGDVLILMSKFLPNLTQFLVSCCLWEYYDTQFLLHVMVLDLSSLYGTFQIQSSTNSGSVKLSLPWPFIKLICFMSYFQITPAYIYLAVLLFCVDVNDYLG